MATVETDYLKQNVEDLLKFKKENPLLVKLTNQQLGTFELIFQLSGLLDLTPTTKVLVGKTGEAFKEAFIFLMSHKAVLGVHMLRIGLEHTRDGLRLLDDQTKSNWYVLRNEDPKDQNEQTNDFFSFDKTSEKFLSTIYESCLTSTQKNEVNEKGSKAVDWEELGRTSGWIWNSVFSHVQANLMSKLLRYGDKNDKTTLELSNRCWKEWKAASKKLKIWNKNSSLLKK